MDDVNNASWASFVLSARPGERGVWVGLRRLPAYMTLCIRTGAKLYRQRKSRQNARPGDGVAISSRRWLACLLTVAVGRAYLSGKVCWSFKKQRFNM